MNHIQPKKGIPCESEFCAVSITADQLEGLSVTPPTDSDVDFTLTVTATAVESNGGATAVVSGSIDVSVDPEADAPTLDLDSTVVDDQSAGAAAGAEDTAIDLDVSALLSDTDSSETLSIEISGVPAGASLNNGTFDTTTGIWTLDSSDLSGLQITPAPDSGDDFQLTISPPQPRLPAATARRSLVRSTS